MLDGQYDLYLIIVLERNLITIVTCVHKTPRRTIVDRRRIMTTKFRKKLTRSVIVNINVIVTFQVKINKFCSKSSELCLSYLSDNLYNPNGRK